MSGRRRAVITGMGIRTAAGSTLDELWDRVTHGRSAARQITRFDTSRTPTKIAAEMDELAPSSVVPDSKVARRLDTVTLYGLDAAKSAWADARVVEDRLDRERFGVVVGTALGGMASTIKSYDGLTARGYRGVGLGATLNSHSGATAGEIAIALRARALAATVGASSASGNDAIGYASDLIQLDECDVVVAGAAEAPLLPVIWASLCVSGVMTSRNDEPESAMRPFDREHDGMLLGEGAAFLVIEELEHALARGAHVYAEVLAHGRSSEIHHPLAPRADGQGPYEAIRKALRRAGLDPSAVDYVNAHGTGTTANDAAESAGIRRALGDAPVAVSSTKPVTGHLLGAAGALETIVAALAVERGVVPLTKNFSAAASGCDLDYVGGESRVKKVRTALNLNCGFGGMNSCLVLGQHAA